MKQPGQFNCPKCGAPFSAADVDAVQDTVTCGSCGHAVPWNSLIRENESPAPLASPPKHLTMQMEDGRITLTYRHSRFKVLLALASPSSGASSPSSFSGCPWDRQKRTSPCPSSPPSLP